MLKRILLIVRTIARYINDSSELWPIKTVFKSHEMWLNLGKPQYNSTVWKHRDGLNRKQGKPGVDELYSVIITFDIDSYSAN